MDLADWIVLGVLAGLALGWMWTGLRVAAVEPPSPDEVRVTVRVDDEALFAVMKSARQVMH